MTLLKLSFFLLLFSLSVSCANDKPVATEPLDESDEDIVSDDESDDSRTKADDEAAALGGDATVASPLPPSQATTATQPVKPEAGALEATAGGLYYISASTLTVREEASESSKVKATLVKGDRITVESIDNGWAKLVGGGFVSTKGVTKTVVGSERRSGGWKNGSESKEESKGKK